MMTLSMPFAVDAMGSAFHEMKKRPLGGLGGCAGKRELK